MNTTNPPRVLALVVLLGAGCDALQPLVDDDRYDAAPPADPDAMVADDAAGSRHVLPAGSAVPSIADDAALVAQIRLNDGLSDGALASSGGVLVRSTGKAAGATVMYWNFGAAPMAGNFAVTAPIYVLADSDGAGGWIPRADHPPLIDSIPGDVRYSPIRRVIYVPVTASYAGEVLPSVEALAEALDLGLVEEPVPAGTWRNMPVVPPDTKLEVGGGALPVDPTEVYGRGFRVTLFPLGGDRGVQPLRNGSMPVGQESRLFSGVPSGTPPTLPAGADAQPLFQYGIPAAPPTTSFNYTPLVTQLDVRLANGVAPSTITSDPQLFARTGSGGINGHYVDTVASYVVTTSVSNKPLQFEEGQP
ncbi:MAG: hypothetical protein K8M05_04315 [Deltaproteobacteria bacterium]|nr:hypothetical protein [Kofleriaceae bacterium]